MTFQLEKRLISVSDYHKMGEVGILTEVDKIELTDFDLEIKVSDILVQ